MTVRLSIRIKDDDQGQITASIPDKQVRSWEYIDETERRMKMRMAHEFAEGWFQCEAHKVGAAS